MKTILFIVAVTLILSGCGTTSPTQTAPGYIDFRCVYPASAPVIPASGTKTVVLQ